MYRFATARRLSAAPKFPTYATFAEPEHTLLGVHHFERGAWLVHGYSLCAICARHTDPRCRTGISSSTVSATLARPVFRPSDAPTPPAFFERAPASVPKRE